jgi:hypothetical protein
MQSMPRSKAVPDAGNGNDHHGFKIADRRS